jgi:hypothetical protein
MRVTGLCVYLDVMNWASGDLALIDELPVSGVVWCGVVWCSPAVGEGMDVPSLVHIHTQIFLAHHSPSPYLSKSIFPTPMDNWINKWVTKCNVQLLSYYYSASLTFSIIATTCLVDLAESKSSKYSNQSSR